MLTLYYTLLSKRCDEKIKGKILRIGVIIGETRRLDKML